MAKKEKETEEVNVITPEKQAMAYLNKNKDDHYNFEPTVYYKTPSSSMLLNVKTNGGLAPGAHRAVGITGGGKTSCSLDYCMHFLEIGKKEGIKRRAVYIMSEGRLSPEVKARSGITFVHDPKEWVDGTCFVFESNVLEAVFGLMGDLIRNNPTDTKYFFIVDSVDMMAKKADLEKSLEDSAQVAGGAVITSVFLKKTALALSKRGHYAFFLSQLRDAIKISMSGPAPTQRQGGANGGHALEHGADFVFEFLPRWKNDIIIDEKSKNKVIGHYCGVRVIKSNNETNGTEINYPIKYGRKNGKSVWIEKEICDLLVMWEWIQKRGSWFYVSENLAEILKNNGLDFPEKLQGLDSWFEFFDERPDVTEFLTGYLQKIIGD
jgi:RecA/RadA recombinase